MLNRFVITSTGYIRTDTVLAVLICVFLGQRCAHSCVLIRGHSGIGLYYADFEASPYYLLTNQSLHLMMDLLGHRCGLSIIFILVF